MLSEQNINNNLVKTMIIRELTVLLWYKNV